MLKQELQRFPGGPLQEFVPGGNAVPGKEQKDLAPMVEMFAAMMKKCYGVVHNLVKEVHHRQQRQTMHKLLVKAQAEAQSKSAP